MVGKNNDYLRETKSNEHFRRFSLRKLSVGVVSVTVAAGFYLGSGTVAQASTTEDASQDAVKTEQVVQQDTDSATDTVTDAVAASDSSSVSDSADSVSSAASDSDSTATSNVASDDNQAASVSVSEEDSQVTESASAVSSEGKDAQAASEVSSQSATESQATQSLTSASATSANESASNAATSSSSDSSESKDVPVASEAGSQSAIESQTTQLPTSAASAIELTNGVQQAATSQQTPAGFTVSDPTYPEGIYKDPDTTHYTYWWIQSSDGQYNIVLSTNRTGDGTVYAFLLDKNNKQLSTYTVNVNKSQEITYGTGRSEINLGTIYNDGESGVFVTNESNSRRRWVSKFDVFYPNATTDTSEYSSISFMIPKVKTQTTTYVTPDGTTVSDSVVQTGLAGQSYTTSGKVVEGYFAINPSNGKGYMSPFGTLNATYTKDWHDGVKAEFTEINIQTGLMHVKVYDGDSIIEEFDLEYGKSKIVKTSQGTLNVHSIYIPQTINIQYVYQKLGNVVISSNDKAFPSASKVTTQYPNDETDSTKAGDVTIPKIEGFKATINGKVVTNYTFNPSDYVDDLSKDINVVYVAEQTAVIKFYDETTKQFLDTTINLTGETGEKISHTEANAALAKLEKQGYVLVRTDFTDDATYDNDASVAQTFTFYLKHGHAIVTPEEDPQNGQTTVTQTIKYQYADGTSTGQPDNVQTLTFQRTGDKDLVTGEVTWPAWSTIASQQTQVVTSPTIKGYTASQSEVPAQTYQADAQDAIYVVKYTADAQHAKIEYIDGETGEVLYTEKADGHTDETISFTKDPSAVIKDLESKGYVFDKDNAQNVILTAGTTYDNDTGVDQAFKYYFKHGHAIVTPEEDPQNGQTTV
ncbi:MAG: YSIRK-type signal peptide-containing protein, partial [Limosilactobacillus gorillae]|nr:YSIRK-type signal peptide-containing protein [Limosilactobacillus gorillae]